MNISAPRIEKRYCIGKKARTRIPAAGAIIKAIDLEPLNAAIISVSTVETFLKK